MRHFLNHLDPSLLFLRARKVFRSFTSKDLRRAARLGVFPSVEVESLLPGIDVHLVLDVGANRGQFALLASATYPGAKIVSFEPGKAARDVLQQVIDSVDADIDLRPFGLCSEAGVATLYVTEADDSSSLLEPSKLQTETHPSSTVASIETIDLRRGDEAFSSLDLDQTVLLKLDIQGAELDALLGMGEALQSVDYVLIELSLNEMYKAQTLAAEVAGFLHGAGFQFERISPPQGFGQTQTQFDALFRRSPKSRETLGVGDLAKRRLIGVEK